MDAPVISILVPNFNNGRQSTAGGGTDLLADLFRSLEETLADDPTPLEILVADDGSTDDSLETCRRWAARTWPSGPRRGRPFCRLTEHEHCGVLSVVANRLTASSRGGVCCRLDGDIVVHTPRWASIIASVFREGPTDLGVVGPKQLGVDGRVHAAGSWILHPRGHHHVGQGLDPALVHRTVEVDHVMGCFYCHRRELWERLGGYDERFLRGQTVDFGLRARLHGWRAWCVPTVEFTHRHAERVVRATAADTRAGVSRTLDVFREKWGFDRLAADLDEVRRRYHGTPLLWNARVFGPALPWPPPARGPVELERSQWGRFAREGSYQAALQCRLDVVRYGRRWHEAMRRVLVPGCGSGLLGHLLAVEGLEVTGVDADEHRIALARSVTGRHAYPGPAPRFRRQRERGRLPVDDGRFDLVLVADLLERHDNPVGLLAEAHRALAPDGLVAIVTRRRESVLDDDPAAGYRASELVQQLRNSRLFEPLADDGVPDVPGALVLLGRRVDEPSAISRQPSAATAAMGRQGAALASAAS